MYVNRQNQLNAHLKNELKADGAIIMKPTNIFYYTGFHSDPHERFFALAVDVKHDKTTLFVPALDEGAAQSAAGVDRIIPIADDDDSYEKFAEAFGLDFATLAFEKQFVTVEQYEQFKQSYPDTQFVAIESFIAGQRLQKSPDEIENVKKAIAITEQSLSETLAYVEPGMTEQEVKTRLEFEFMQAGADNIAFDSLILSGKKSALPHGSSGHEKIDNGDFLLFDIGVTVNGYHSDLSRTFVIGEATEQQQLIYDTVRQANEEAIKAVQAGRPLKEVDLAARNYIAQKGYGEYFTHRIGHGLGMEVHELPSMHGSNEELIKPGMLFTIEPGIYVPEIGGVRIEDNIYVDGDGEVNVLSSYSKELTSI